MKQSWKASLILGKSYFKSKTYIENTSSTTKCPSFSIIQQFSINFYLHFIVGISEGRSSAMQIIYYSTLTDLQNLSNYFNSSGNRHPLDEFFKRHYQSQEPNKYILTYVHLLTQAILIQLKRADVNLRDYKLK